MLELEHFYRFLFEQSNDAVFILDLQGKILMANKKAAEMFGYSHEELLALSFKELSAEVNKSEEVLRRLLKGEKIPIYERTFLRKTGEKIFVDTNVELVCNTNGKPLHIQSIIRDITERKMAENALRYQLSFEKMVAELSSILFNAELDKVDKAINETLRLTGEFFNVDRSYIFQYTEDGSFMDNTHEWYAPGVKPQQDRMKRLPVDSLPWFNQQIQRQEHVYIPDVALLPEEAGLEKKEFSLQEIKTLFTIPFTIPLIKDKRVTGFLGFDSVKQKKCWVEEQISLLKVVAEIITSAINKHRAEEALKSSEEKYRNILDSMEDGYYEVNLNGDVVFSNHAAARMLGYTLHDFIGMNFREFCRFPETVKDVFKLKKLSKKPSKIVTIEMMGKDSSIAYVEVSLSLNRNSKGEITGFKGVGRNVTERKRFEEQLSYLSLHDQLTGLFNRAYFENELTRLDGSREYPITIISLDLNGLKLINDTMGHIKGDELLKACAVVTKRALRRSDILCRVGGDEFAIIMPKTAEEAASKIAGRIAYQIEQYNIKNSRLPLSISIGAASAESPEIPLVKLYQKADDLMYRDKMSRGAGVRSQIVNTLLTALAERDFITEGHTQRLGELCRKVGEKIGLHSRQLTDLLLLAQVHDLGKVGIPDNVLFKPGPLTGEEWEIMRLHAEKGYRIASASPDLSGIADLILKHHERWDGKGYPLGLQGEDIPIECRILAIVDAFDAMTHERCYSKAIGKEEALTELKRCAGTHFDPQLVEIFLNTLN